MKFLEEIFEKKTVEVDGKKRHYYFLMLTCPVCGRKFCVSKRKKPVLIGRPFLSSPRGKYLVSFHKINDLQCQGSYEIVS